MIAANPTIVFGDLTTKNPFGQTLHICQRLPVGPARLNHAQPLNVLLDSLQARREKQIFRIGLLFDHPLFMLVANNRL
jgi:hypothetical protein